MRRTLISLSLVLLVQSVGLAQTPDRLEGRWAGTVEGLQGKQQAVATFKKEGDKYTGTITALSLKGFSSALPSIRTSIVLPSGRTVKVAVPSLGAGPSGLSRPTHL